MSDKLLPCPFCGDAPEEIVDATRLLGVHRITHRCAVIPTFSLEASSPERVAEKWNRRAPSTLGAELEKAREAAIEEAAKVAECHFDDRGNGRSGHHSEIDWTDGYRDATRGAATAIRALSQDKEARE